VIGKRYSLRIFCEKNPQSVTWYRSGDGNLCFPPHRECDSVSKLMDLQEKGGTVPGVVCRSEIVYRVHSLCLLTWNVNKGTLSIFHQTHTNECPARLVLKHFWSSYTLCTEHVSMFLMLESCDTLFRNAVWTVYLVSFWTNNSAHTVLFSGSWILSWRVTHSRIWMQCGGKQNLLHIPGTQWNFESFSRGWPIKSFSTFIKKLFGLVNFWNFLYTSYTIQVP